MSPTCTDHLQVLLYKAAGLVRAMKLDHMDNDAKPVAAEDRVMLGYKTHRSLGTADAVADGFN